MTVAVAGCKQQGSTNGESKKVKIKTDYGNMIVKLHDETPKHSENFVKLAKEGYYDSTLFHRVIDGFMIQGGDPDSKGAAPGQQLGEGGPGYKLEAELKEGLFHKKGAIAAARQGDQMNPEKKSSGSQFYIVDGKTYTDEELNKVEEQMNLKKKQQLFMDMIQNEGNQHIQQRLQKYRQNQNREAFQSLVDSIEPVLEKRLQEKGKFTFTEEQRKAYKNVGGAPHLDGNYTVFGQVVEGLNVIDSIATVETDRMDRPKEDIMIKMEVVD
ncbi:MAG: peptidylprolyl isomerase [Bacteroidales bacterium]|nr:peptidylprolyl isomerase [Bacteroidales bacterium]